MSLSALISYFLLWYWCQSQACILSLYELHLCLFIRMWHLADLKHFYKIISPLFASQGRFRRVEFWSHEQIELLLSCPLYLLIRILRGLEYHLQILISTMQHKLRYMYLCGLFRLTHLDVGLYFQSIRFLALSFR